MPFLPSSYFIEQKEQIQEKTYENMESRESTPEQENNQAPENNGPQQQIYETI